MPEKLILFCGPSGSGKTSIVHHLLRRIPVLAFSVSATTRARRPSETDGIDYYFITADLFRAKVDRDEFLEWEEVYANGFYGTLRSEISRITALGRVPVFDVDVEGGLRIRQAYRASLLDVFVRPPDIETLKQRLRARATETDESYRMRIAKAEQELAYGPRFSHILVNGDFDTAAAEAEALVNAFLDQPVAGPSTNRNP